VPYDTQAQPTSTTVGLFTAHYDPRLWKTNSPNMAFDAMTDADATWMTRKICALSEEQIRAAVRAGQISDSADEEHVVQTLLARRDVLRQTWPVPE
jgi:hypothetical protein